ncbi:GcrA family cell cycle regulator [Pannonibacter sp. SL95]|uniref:GcrA family cell cycle regulator n=1 Tax=Pannonibacter sp. SL95 TaxID=2995153 RepID=UPI002275E2DF|nr:GcrA family cell cycle regulator [Pannonibacter sp. SL95]MCY1708172.1 GcrA cell cycle regulator [Pannonibacter sp. SL95]
MSWTDERVELLKKLWTDGLSASQIAAELGGVTRNAVIGKVHRLGLSGRAKAVAPAAKPRRARTPATASPATPRPAQAPVAQSRGATALKMEPMEEAAVEVQPQTEPVAEIVPITERATILTLTERTCKWPIGDPSTQDFYFCGRHSDPGVPYCAHHCRIAYQPVNDRRRDKDRKALRA